MTSETESVHRRLVAKTPADLLAFVPLALGFQPEESLVVIAIGCRGPHARVDLPQTPQEAAAIGATLGATLTRHHVEQVAVMVFSAHAKQRCAHLDALAQALEAGGLIVGPVVMSDHDRWYLDVHDVGSPFDSSTHRFRAEAVLDGVVVLESRAQLQERVAADPMLLDRLSGLVPDRATVDAPSTCWRNLEKQILAQAAEEQDLSNALSLVQSSDGLHLVWPEVSRADAGRHLDFWCRALAGAHPEAVPAAAAIVGYLAWLCGNGALAWCALERAESEYSRPTEASYGPRAMTRFVQGLLEGAIAPPCDVAP